MDLYPDISQFHGGVMTHEAHVFLFIFRTGMFFMILCTILIQTPIYFFSVIIDTPISPITTSCERASRVMLFNSTPLRIRRFSSMARQFFPNWTVSGKIAGIQNLSISEV